MRRDETLWLWVVMYALVYGLVVFGVVFFTTLFFFEKGLR